MSSGWFDCTEPTLSTSLQGKQGVQGAYALVRGGFSTSNLIEPTVRTTMRFITEIARCRKVSVRSNHPELMCQNSPHLAISVMKWFDVLEPPRTRHKHHAHLVSPAEVPHDVVRVGSMRFVASSTSNLDFRYLQR